MKVVFTVNKYSERSGIVKVDWMFGNQKGVETVMIGDSLTLSLPDYPALLREAADKLEAHNRAQVGIGLST